MGEENRRTMASAIGGMDDIFNPAAARARQELETQKERRVATPSPGDKLLKDGIITINVPPKSKDTESS